MKTFKKSHILRLSLKKMSLFIPSINYVNLNLYSARYHFRIHFTFLIHCIEEGYYLLFQVIENVD